MYDQTAMNLLAYHGSMLADRERTERLRQAIEAVVRPGDVVLDLGCGTGILSFFACRVGARHVYAIERAPIIEVARRLAAANGLAERITFVPQVSTDARLPERCDVLITETIGGLALDEGILEWVIDARKRHLRPDCRIIPRRLAAYLRPVELGDEPGIRAWREAAYSFDLSPGGDLAANNLWLIKPSAESDLGQPAKVLDIDLTTVERDAARGETEIEISRAGLLEGLAGSFEAELATGITLSNASLASTPSWSHGLLPLRQPIPVVPGDRWAVTIEVAAGGAVWNWAVAKAEAASQVPGSSAQAEGGVPGSCAAGRAPAVPEPAGAPPGRQSTFLGQLLSLDALHRRADGYRPRLSSEGAFDVFVLGLMDGTLTVREIAERAHTRFPDLHPDFAGCLRRVRSFSERYGGGAGHTALPEASSQASVS